ncbi:Matrixin [Actinobacteria bacterium IMCC26207]|nr:Matrixin [Actinobacteria bacterium IMCC26207]
MEDDPAWHSPSGEDDPFESWVLDDSFVQSAEVVEPTSADRERLARQANLQRMLADQSAAQENQFNANRRFAPGEDDLSWATGDDEFAAPRRKRTWLKLSAALVILSVVAVYVLAQFIPLSVSVLGLNGAPDPPSGGEVPGDMTFSDSRVNPAPQTAPSSDAGLLRPDGWPSASAEQQSTPLGFPGEVPDGGGTHGFIQMQPDGVTPVAYDPCRPIHYVTRPDGAPDGADQLITEAVASVSQATGLVFINDGATDEAPSEQRDSFLPERYGDRWAPVLIAWSNPTESPDLGGDGSGDSAGSTLEILGYAGSSSAGYAEDSDPGAADSSGQQIFVSGGLTLDGPDFAELLSERGGYAEARATVMHELGHLVGLDHVSDDSQLMSPTLSGDLTDYASGDLEGLAVLGQGQCLPDI